MPGQPTPRLQGASRFRAAGLPQLHHQHPKRNGAQTMKNNPKGPRSAKEMYKDSTVSAGNNSPSKHLAACLRSWGKCRRWHRRVETAGRWASSKRPSARRRACVFAYQRFRRSDKSPSILVARQATGRICTYSRCLLRSSCAGFSSLPLLCCRGSKAAVLDNV